MLSSEATARGVAQASTSGCGGVGAPPAQASNDETAATSRADEAFYNSPCRGAYYNVSQARMKYQVEAGTLDGRMKPIEVRGDQFVFCVDQVNEITGGRTQSAPMTVQMTRDWCNWRSSLSGEEARPEWSQSVCTGMAQMMAFALRNRLEEPGGVQASEVCRQLFLSTGIMYRFGEIVDNAWTKDLRGVRLKPPKPPPSDDPGMQELLERVTAQSEEVNKDLRKHRAAERAVEEAKEAVAAFSPDALAKNVQERVDALKEQLPIPGLNVPGLR